MDDGSSDSTGEVCERLSDDLELRYLRIENSGISAAKRLGLFAARAPLVLFFDDDDLADPRLLEAHLETHREHPEVNVAVLGYTTWAAEIEVTPLMNYVTEIGQLLFSYPSIEDGQVLDYTYFWGGRSSCKRSLLAEQGSFDQELPAMEDIELGFRLAKHGLKVVYTSAARSFMVRPVTFDEFARRSTKRGRAMWLYNAKHDDPEVRRYCGVAEALRRWPEMVPALAEKVEQVRALERRNEAEGGLSEEELGELHELYRWTFDAHQAKGMAEQASDALPGPAGDGIGQGSVKPPPSIGFPRICPDPVFIIGSPRSGTSIVAWSLAQHSALCTESESEIYYHLLKDGHLRRAFETSIARPDGTWLRNRDVTLDQFLEHVGLGLNALLTETMNGGRWIDQTPANTLVADTLARMFPRARFLHVIRDGRRVVNSMINFEGTFRDPEVAIRMRSAGQLPEWAWDFEAACRTWALFTGTAVAFCERHPDRSFTVSNERLITDPDGMVRDALEFLRVPPEPEPARYLRTHRINSSFASRERPVDQPPGFLTEPWGSWTSSERTAFRELAGETMLKCGLVTGPDLFEIDALTDRPYHDTAT